MKTAEEIFKSEINKAGCMSMQVALNSMKIYAKQVAEQELKDAANRLKDKLTLDEYLDVLETEVQTP